MTPANKAELISMGYIELNGTNTNYITVAKSGSKYFYFAGFSSGDTIKINKFPTLTYLHLGGSDINWTYSEALPSTLTYLFFGGANINWTYSGALPSTLTHLQLNGTNINWTYSGALPSTLTYLYLNGAKINWTYYDVSGTSNITDFALYNFVTTAMTPAQLIQLLQSMAQRVGNIAATCTIGDYQNTNPTAQQIAEATPNINGTDAQRAKY